MKHNIRVLSLVLIRVTCLVLERFGVGLKIGKIRLASEMNGREGRKDGKKEGMEVGRKEERTSKNEGKAED